MQKNLPFKLEKTSDFYTQLSQWVGDVFYDIFPENGLEIRDEQVFMAFQLEKAFSEKEIIMAEAGVGTGKTFVYLLYAICYARYTGKPAIIACADETLIEQLVKNEGDIKKLNDLLNINIDVRLAKSQDQYLCIKKLSNAIADFDHEAFNNVHDSLPDFVISNNSLTKYEPYGDRKDYPELSNKEWNHISWDVFQDCFTCDDRHKCGQTLSRDYYRKSADLIVCSHDFFMKHVWTEESRKREGQLPLIPNHSCVIFDEGHLLEYAAQKALTLTIKEEQLPNLLNRLFNNNVRVELEKIIEETLKENEILFDEIYNVASEVEESYRLEILKNDNWLKHVKNIRGMLSEIGDALVFESEMYTIPEYELNIVNEYLDELENAFKLLLEENVIFWGEKTEDTMHLVVMPQLIQDVMKKYVWSKKIPYIFSSATLSNKKDFTYITRSLGIEHYKKMNVDSPYDYEEMMKIDVVVTDRGIKKHSKAINYINENNGRTLILFPNRKELINFKNSLTEDDVKYEYLFEGDREISNLVSTFQNNEHTVLCAEHLWEGLDIPGPSLSQVIVWGLPYPPNDPVFNSFRKNTNDPFKNVDLPYMLLRLRQGIGRLIRNEADFGKVVIFMDNNSYQDVFKDISDALPVKPVVIND
ncbi:MAG: helicase c2 [Bacillales bacterium]|nr:helicase c2 [Bacillales bacterium]